MTNSCSNFVLADRFRLNFANAADNFLKNCAPKADNILERLRSRRISSIVLESTGSIVSRLGTTVRGDFCVWIPVDLHPRMKAIQLGACVARTFHYNLTRTPVQNYLAAANEGTAMSFYNAFAVEWTKRVTVAAIVDLLDDDRRMYITSAHRSYEHSAPLVHAATLVDG